VHRLRPRPIAQPDRSQLGGQPAEASGKVTVVRSGREADPECLEVRAPPRHTIGAEVPTRIVELCSARSCSMSSHANERPALPGRRSAQVQETRRHVHLGIVPGLHVDALRQQHDGKDAHSTSPRCAIDSSSELRLICRFCGLVQQLEKGLHRLGRATAAIC